MDQFGAHQWHAIQLVRSLGTAPPNDDEIRGSVDCRQSGAES
jgi:hypothetical protein